MASTPSATAVQKPIAVIYPAIHPLFISTYSPCHRYLYGAIGHTTGTDHPVTSTNTDAAVIDSATSNTTQASYEPVRFIFVGRLSNEKSIGLILRALSLILDPSSSTSACTDSDEEGMFPLTESECGEFNRLVRVDIYGDGTMKASLIKLARTFNLLSDDDSNDDSAFDGTTISSDSSISGVRGVVTFHDAVYDKSALITLISAADCMINPRASGETFGVVHLEASAVGTPVIAYDRKANTESISHGRLIQDSSIIALARAIHEFYIEYRMYNTSKRERLRKGRCKALYDIQTYYSIDTHAHSLSAALELLQGEEG